MGNLTGRPEGVGGCQQAWWGEEARRYLLFQEGPFTGWLGFLGQECLEFMYLAVLVSASPSGLLPYCLENRFAFQGAVSSPVIACTNTSYTLVFYHCFRINKSLNEILVCIFKLHL